MATHERRSARTRAWLMSRRGRCLPALIPCAPLVSIGKSARASERMPRVPFCRSFAPSSSASSPSTVLRLLSEDKRTSCETKCQQPSLGLIEPM